MTAPPSVENRNLSGLLLILQMLLTPSFINKRVNEYQNMWDQTMNTMDAYMRQAELRYGFKPQAHGTGVQPALNGLYPVDFAVLCIAP